MPVDVAATLAGIDALVKRLEVATKEIVAEGAHLIQAGAMDRVAVRTGTLRRSIDVTGPYPMGADGWIAQVGPTVIYGRIQELGGHIYPKRVKMLRWYGADGSPIFARHVYHQAKPYLKPAVAAARPAIEALAVDRLAVAIKGG